MSTSDDPERKPFSESHLDSPEYRERLLRKLNTLIAVLEVATAKVRRSLQGPAPDVAKLTRIQKNLQDTLKVCLRARNALQQRGKLTAGLTKDLSKVNPDLAQSARLLHGIKTPEAGPKRGMEVEMSSKNELERFQKLGKIDDDEIQECDLDDLARRLMG
jgi:hypothetical protein